MCRKRHSTFSTLPRFNFIATRRTFGNKSERGAKEMMQSLMDAAIFRWQSLPNDNRKARRAQRFQISVLSFPLNSTPLVIVSFCSNAHPSSAQKFQTICMPWTVLFSKKKKSASSLLHVDSWLGAALTPQLDYCYFYHSNLTIFSILFFLRHISYHMIPPPPPFHYELNKHPYILAHNSAEKWLIWNTQLSLITYKSSGSIHCLNTRHISQSAWMYKSSY